MTWIKHVGPTTLRQEADIPYVVLDDGVHLCSTNMYEEGTYISHQDHCLVFKVDRRKLGRQSSNYFKLRSFPAVIPFEDVVYLDKCVVNGVVEPSPVEPSEDGPSILLTCDKYIRGLEPEQSYKFLDTMDSYDHSFIVVTDEVTPDIRLLDGPSTTIMQNETDWGRICVIIADRLCLSSSRGQNWTKNIAFLDVACYGLGDLGCIKEITELFSFIGIDVSPSWEA